MSKFDELTDGELSRFVALGEEYQRLKVFTKDDIHWIFKGVIDGSSVQAQIPDWATISLKNHMAEAPKNLTVNGHNMKRWADTGYIDIFPSSLGSSRQGFILTPRGLAFLAYHKKSARRRWLIDTWADIRPDLRTAAFSVIASVVASVLATALLFKLGFIH